MGTVWLLVPLAPVAGSFLSLLPTGFLSRLELPAPSSAARAVPVRTRSAGSQECVWSFTRKAAGASSETLPRVGGILLGHFEFL